MLVIAHQDASYQAMVAREHEEEQTQRSMLALNKLKLMVIGKTYEEAEKDITKVILHNIRAINILVCRLKQTGQLIKTVLLHFG